MGKLLLLLLLLTGCGREDKCELNPEVAKVPVTLRLERLERSFFQVKSTTDAGAFLAQHPLFANQYLQLRQYPSADALTPMLTRLATNADLQQLGSQAAAAFPEEQLQADLKRLFQHVRYYFPKFRVPPVNTFVSGLGLDPFSKDLFVNDSLMVLSLDFFVGPKAKYRPNAPEYILRRYTPAHLLPAAAQAISSKYNRRLPTNQTMLSEMVQYGKALYFVEKVLPCTQDSILIGFTAAELAGVEFNEGKIWAHFIEKKLLYNTAPFTIQKYVGERPSIPEIDKTCPGRVGAWVGWQIVRKYMAEHPQVTLPQLMAETDAQRILTASKYRPKRK
ncbi:gliding motility lipoprotein GldB [Hymenobacter sp. BT175]|uniref:gliding motility lipoprotein GldB n=1 Tax=Hymenobacter translucens TaxID=2886507 RepID=UPI001D0E5E91|nr:gliding motility lipoprotein GldB [Hymenobacter translucens]MCC2546161.1 gliding motility lipoprotein GldB [Hymenobacter translucens]